MLIFVYLQFLELVMGKFVYSWHRYCYFMTSDLV